MSSAEDTDLPERGHAPWASGDLPAWALRVQIPDFLALREGTRPIVIVAPHGGRRVRPISRGDSVNDLYTAEIAWELAERTEAHAIINHSLDRNEIDLNRITHLVSRAPDVLSLLSAAIADAGQGGQAPLVLFVHGWNMVVPCCDVGVGLRLLDGRPVGRYPTIGQPGYEDRVASIERELRARGIAVGIGRRYPASGRDNAAQLFSGRHVDHGDAAVAALSRLAVEGGVDAAQLELGIPLRWPGPQREALLEGLTAALRWEIGDRHHFSRSASGESDATTGYRSTREWSGHAHATSAEREALEPGQALQAVLDRDGRHALFAGAEPTGPHSMAARFCIVAADGSMLLLVGEGPWDGAAGRYRLEGFEWRMSDGGTSGVITMDAPMVRYPTHDAYLDLEAGLSRAGLVHASCELLYEAQSETHGKLVGHVMVGGERIDVDTTAFRDGSGRRAATARPHVRLRIDVTGTGPLVIDSDIGDDATLVIDETASPRGTIRPAEGGTQPLESAEIVARVPVWRPVAEGVFARWTFGVVRCRFTGERGERHGLFDSLEIFRAG